MFFYLLWINFVSIIICCVLYTEFRNVCRWIKWRRLKLSNQTTRQTGSTITSLAFFLLLFQFHRFRCACLFRRIEIIVNIYKVLNKGKRKIKQKSSANNHDSSQLFWSNANVKPGSGYTGSLSKSLPNQIDSITWCDHSSNTWYT